jgi:hypothetical protein
VRDEGIGLPAVAGSLGLAGASPDIVLRMMKGERRAKSLRGPVTETGRSLLLVNILPLQTKKARVCRKPSLERVPAYGGRVRYELVYFVIPAKVGIQQGEVVIKISLDELLFSPRFLKRAGL